MKGELWEGRGGEGGWLSKGVGGSGGDSKRGGPSYAAFPNCTKKNLFSSFLLSHG